MYSASETKQIARENILSIATGLYPAHAQLRTQSTQSIQPRDSKSGKAQSFSTDSKQSIQPGNSTASLAGHRAVPQSKAVCNSSRERVATLGSKGWSSPCKQEVTSESHTSEPESERRDCHQSFSVEETEAVRCYFLFLTTY